MIWIIGGTSDAVKIADLLLDRQKTVMVSATTTYGIDYVKSKPVQVVQQKLEISDMQDLMKDNKVDCVIDASHPFAEQVSKNAIEACRLENISYLRFERKSTEFMKAQYYKDYGQMTGHLSQTKGNILLTIGSKNVYRFSVLDGERLTARVLPHPDSLARCMDAGLKLHQIIAVKGPLSKATNKALMMEYDIDHLVTKDTGTEGGLMEKVKAAHELGILVHLLQRPRITYPKVYEDYNELMAEM